MNNCPINIIHLVRGFLMFDCRRVYRENMNMWCAILHCHAQWLERTLKRTTAILNIWRPCRGRVVDPICVDSVNYCNRFPGIFFHPIQLENCWHCWHGSRVETQEVRWSRSCLAVSLESWVKIIEIHWNSRNLFKMAEEIWNDLRLQLANLKRN